MIRAGAVAKVSAHFPLVPPLSALFAWPLLGEATPPTAWAGRTLASVGVGLVSWRKGVRERGAGPKLMLSAITLGLGVKELPALAIWRASSPTRFPSPCPSGDQLTSP